MYPMTILIRTGFRSFIVRASAKLHARALAIVSAETNRPRHPVTRKFGELIKESHVPHTYWNDMYFSWGYLLWFGILFLLFSSIGNWGYTYRAHRRFGQPLSKDALDILSERYARGDINQEEYARMKSEISRG